MLTLPAVHPFLLSLLTDDVCLAGQSTDLPEQSWHRIVEEALTQRLTPLLFAWVDLSGHQSSVPSDLRNRLKRELIEHMAWNLLLTTELRTILVECEQRGVPCVPIRGPVLAEQLYGARSARQMDDLDLLVHRTDLSTVKNIFERLGYRQHEHRPGFHEAFSYSLEFVHPTHGFIVEPHWTLAYPPHLDIKPMQPIWDRCMRQRWMDIEIRCLAHEDLLLHLCLHIHHKGRQAALLWFYELDAVIRQHEATLNWNVFIEQAHRMEQSAAVADVLNVLVKTFHSSVPDSVVKQLTEPPADSSPSLSSMMSRRILLHSFPDGREEFAILASLQRAKDKLRYIFTLLFPSPQYMARRYGSSSPARLVAFYIARCVRIGAEGVRLAVTWITTVLATRQG